ncbi:hypothetical protein D3C78_1457410 [compost metagenome]
MRTLIFFFRTRSKTSLEAACSFSRVFTCTPSDGRVTYRLPFWFSTARLTPATGPDALPKLTIRPRGSMQSSEVSQVSLPTPS